MDKKDYEKQAEAIVATLWKDGYDPKLEKRLGVVKEAIAVALQQEAERALQRREPAEEVHLKLAMGDAINLFSLLGACKPLLDFDIESEEVNSCIVMLYSIQAAVRDTSWLVQVAEDVESEQDEEDDGSAEDVGEDEGGAVEPQE